MIRPYYIRRAVAVLVGVVVLSLGTAAPTFAIGVPFPEGLKWASGLPSWEGKTTEGGLRQLANGAGELVDKWGWYTPGEARPLRIFTQTDAEALIDRATGAATDIGNSGNTAADVTGATSRDVEVASDVATKLKELPVGESAAAEADVAAQADGTLSTVGEMLSSLSGAELGAVGGTFIAGVGIGTGIDELLGWPSFLPTESAEHPSPKYHYRYTYGPERLEDPEPCANPFGRPKPPPHPEPGGVCMGERQSVGVETEEEYLDCKSEPCVEKISITSATQHVSDVVSPFVGPWEGFPHLQQGATAEESLYNGDTFYNVPEVALKQLTVPQGTTGCATSGVTEDPCNEIEPPKKRETKIPPVPIGKGGGHLESLVAHESPELGEGLPVPGPTTPTIPFPESGELASHYKERIEGLGYTSVTLVTVSEAYINPHVGPNEVANVIPSPGTVAEHSTPVRVEANPEYAPAPKEVGGGFPEVVPPGIKLPNFAVLCTNFPFGVPCWLYESFASWAGTAETPVFTIGSFEVHGYKVPEVKVSLAPLNGLMEIVRPFMILFATIGIVILYYKWATGKQVGESGNPPGETFEENDAWHNTPEDEGGPRYR